MGEPMSVSDRVRAPSLLVHPLPIGAAAVLVVNDHLLKAAAWPSAAVAGKLSDLAGLFLFPILATALTRRRFATAWVIATAAAFTALKLWPAFNRAVEVTWGRNALDPTDLACLPVLAFSWLYLQRGHAPAGALRRAAATGFVAIACAATPAPRYQRDYPFWEVTAGGPHVFGCAHAAVWVVKSGKTGFGLTVRLHAAGGPCGLSLHKASLRLASGRVVRAALDRRHVRLSRCQVEHIYIPFLFDSEAAWNHGVRSGVVNIAFVDRSVLTGLSIPVEHRLQAYQRDRHRPPPETPPLSACAADAAPPKEIAK